MKSFFIDYKVNRGNSKARLILLLFRFSKLGLRGRLGFFLMIPYLVFYRIIVEWVLGVELPWKTRVGERLVIYHGHALVINDGAVIGNDCVLRHCTTIGNRQYDDGSFSKSPVIGNHVDIGCNVCIIGPVTIGDHVVIGAGSVVTKDIPSHVVVAGNPAKIIRERK